MMKKYYIFICGLFLISCSDGPFDMTYFNDGFKGITETSSSSPEPIGVIDPDDWCVDDVKTNFDGSIPMRHAFYPAYPNPAEKPYGFTLKFSIAQQSFVNLSIINSDNQVVIQLMNDVFNAGVYSVNVPTESLSAGTVYRAIFKSDLLICHGDILIK